MCAGDGRKLLQAVDCGKNNALPVAAGQSCDTIAAELKIDVDDIVKLNGDKCSSLKAGDTLCIPSGPGGEDQPPTDNKEGL